MNLTYDEFLNKKLQLGGEYGFDPTFMPDFLFDFQKYLLEWSIKKGKSAIFADCGLGKTPMQLVWAQNIVEKTNKPVLIATPLAVSYQVLREAEKFGIDCKRSIDGKLFNKSIVVTNYERLHHFDPNDFSGLVCDESSILKNFNGAIKGRITNFMTKLPYRLLCTATAAPNDYIELGTSSEALGELGNMDMLIKFFKNEQNTINPNRNFGEGGKWRFKKHAEVPFWKWVCSWARAMRKPSDFGFSDERFVLPQLIENTHVVESRTSRPGMFMSPPAVGMSEEREERKRTINERCEKVASLVEGKDKSLIWCHLNPEGDLLKKIIKGSEQIKGGDPDEKKEEILIAFATGELKYLVTKPKIGAFGLNLQRCAHIVFFPSHSYEQYYQGVRRCWRFGQKRDVIVDTVATEGEVLIIKNLLRKAQAADRMFTELVFFMNESIKINRRKETNKNINLPAWIIN